MKSNSTAVAAMFARGVGVELTSETKSQIPKASLAMFLSMRCVDSAIIDFFLEMLIAKGLLTRDGMTLRNKSGHIVARSSISQFVLELMEHNFPCQSPTN
mgnify:CR=1 FL=1